MYSIWEIKLNLIPNVTAVGRWNLHSSLSNQLLSDFGEHCWRQFVTSVLVMKGGHFPDISTFRIKHSDMESNTVSV